MSELLTPFTKQCELPQGAVGTPRCTKTAEHIADMHGCLLNQPEHEWVRVQVCTDHVIVAHKAWTQSKRHSRIDSASCADCGKKFHRFGAMLRKVGVV
ncbi:hypothetical protein CH267_00815 [Rhodococcus sp. 06-621-2]|nr:hypothetical protein [Rhodococcus sp. 06-621-2]OZC62115.1 hypothetical protein CH267_00815 [Rhodococcus sp. 06-621-2]